MSAAPVGERDGLRDVTGAAGEGFHATDASVASDAGNAKTVRPPFDPQEFARQSERATLPPPDKTPSETPELVSGTMEVFWPVESTTIPELAVAKEDLEWFDIPPLARKLLEHVDGATPIETICVLCGIPLDDASNLFDELAREGIVSTR